LYYDRAAPVCFLELQENGVFKNLNSNLMYFSLCLHSNLNLLQILLHSLFYLEMIR